MAGRSPSSKKTGLMAYFINERDEIASVAVTENGIPPTGVPKNMKANAKTYNAKFRLDGGFPGDAYMGFWVGADPTLAESMLNGASSSSGSGSSGGGRKTPGPPPSGDDSENEESFNDDGEETKRGGKRMVAPASESTIKALLDVPISYAASNSSVSLAGVRAGFASYRSFPGVKPIHQAALAMLGLSSVGAVKRLWAPDMFQVMKKLGSVPSIFVGEGGTFKAFLYLGYDILAHLSQENKQSWPDWLMTIFTNCERVCPGGNIMNAQVMLDDKREKAADRNAAIMMAKRAFQGWTPNKNLRYLDLILMYEGDGTSTVSHGVVTPWKAAKTDLQKK